MKNGRYVLVISFESPFDRLQRDPILVADRSSLTNRRGPTVADRSSLDLLNAMMKAESVSDRHQNYQI